jgi:hypothetical protein
MATAFADELDTILGWTVARHVQVRTLAMEHREERAFLGRQRRAGGTDEVPALRAGHSARTPEGLLLVDLCKLRAS